MDTLENAQKRAEYWKAESLAANAEIERLRTALRLVMRCAGDIDRASDADLEAALECGDAETERQANAWLVARAALMPNCNVTGAEPAGGASGGRRG